MSSSSSSSSSYSNVSSNVSSSSQNTPVSRNKRDQQIIIKLHEDDKRAREQDEVGSILQGLTNLKEEEGEDEETKLLKGLLKKQLLQKALKLTKEDD